MCTVECMANIVAANMLLQGSFLLTVVLLAFGLSTTIPDFGVDSWATWISVIVIMALISVLLRLIYYLLLHVWSSVILSDKKLLKKELQEKKQIEVPEPDNLITEHTDKIQKKFFKYVFVQRNTWILGKLKNIHITLIVLPKELVEGIGRRFQDIRESFLVFKKFLSSKNCGFYAVIISLVSLRCMFLSTKSIFFDC